MKEILLYFKTRKASWLPLALLFFLGIATLLTLTLTQKKQELRSRAVADNGQLTFANLNPATVNPGGTFSVSVNMNGGGQTVTGADIIVNFPQAKFTLTNITKNALTTVYKTYAPVDAVGNFDTARVIACANTGSFNGDSAKCPSGAGKVEFGIVSFDWNANGGSGALTSPDPTSSNLSPAATLTFSVNAGATTDTLSFVNNGITATTDSNIVVIPAAGGDPEDILQAAPYTGSSITVTVAGGASPTPGVSPTPTPSPSPTPSASPGACNACYNFNGIGNIDVQDISSIANIWNTHTGDATYQTKYDVYCGAASNNTVPNPDGVINVLDISVVSNRWNQTSCTPP